MLRVLVACEVSGIVRDAFRKRGHDAWSVDLLPSDTPGPHIICDLSTWKGKQLLKDHWDLMIAHPPCTYLAASGSRWRKGIARQIHTTFALRFVATLMCAPVPHIAIENPKGILSTVLRKPDQVLHPYFFGHPTLRATCLWLKNLPPLRSTRHVPPQWVTLQSGKKYTNFSYEMQNVSLKDRAKARSQTFPGIAEAMVQQWGDFFDT